jgi:peptide/nickel transport system permease protein
MAETEEIVSTTEAEKSPSGISHLFRRLMREKPLGFVCAIVVVLLLLITIFADLIAPYGYKETHPGDQLQGPSAQYWLGTDNLGRDLFSRVVYGARISVIIGLTASFVSSVISIIIGTMSGFLGGKFDLFVQRFVDGWQALPDLVLLMLVIGVLGPGIMQLIIALGVNGGISGSRFVRGAVMSVKENVYFEAARATGTPTSHIIIRHVLPNIMAPLIIMFSGRVPGIVLTEASLSFLGLGIPPPFPSWGGMLSGASRVYMMRAPGMAIWPGLALATMVFAINMFGDAMRDLLDPRLRGGMGGLGGYAGVRRKRRGILAILGLKRRVS